MIIKPKAYLFFLSALLLNCAGDSHSENEVATDERDSAETINDIALPDTSYIPVEGTEFDQNCEIHFASAMNQDKPEDLLIVHCEYWSSAHPVWLEHTYHFEFEENELFFDDILDYNNMLRMEDPLLIEKQQKDWFLPKEVSNYEGYYTEDDFDDFQLFRDLKTGHIFIRGSQY